jgi:probable HAF family extracellular repeat protein
MWRYRVGKFLRMAALVAVGATAASAIAARDWTLVDIGTLGGPGSYGAGVSNSGLVVGCSDVPAGGAHAFIYDGVTIQDLGLASTGQAGSSCALAINNSGTVAGRNSSGELVVWQGGAVKNLGVKGNIGAISDSGTIVGSFVDGATARAFTYRDGTLTNLGTLNNAEPNASSAANGINAKGQVVGVSNGRAFIYDNGAMRDLGTLGGALSVAKSINARSEIVGMSSDQFGAPTPFAYEGAMRALPAPTYSSAIAINERGQIVGSGEGIYGYLIDDGVYTRLSQLPVVVAKGWRRLEPTGINDRGWIVGTATDAEGNLRAFLLVPGNDKRFSRN